MGASSPAAMPKQSVEALVEGGKATAAPPLGPALGPLGVNISSIIGEINKKTGAFAGMQVPVKILVDTETKEFTISVGTPPTSALLKKEVGIEKASGNPKTEHVADMRIEQAIKVAKMKESSLMGRTLSHRVKEVIGTAGGMGILVEGVSAREAQRLVDQGKFKDEIAHEKTEISAEELEELRREREALRREIEEKHAELEKRAKAIIASMEGKPRSETKRKLVEGGIPTELIDELLPREGAPTEAASTPRRGPRPLCCRRVSGRPE